MHMQFIQVRWNQGLFLRMSDVTSAQTQSRNLAGFANPKTFASVVIPAQAGIQLFRCTGNRCSYYTKFE
jgi:hypothetical protein